MPTCAGLNTAWRFCTCAWHAAFTCTVMFHFYFLYMQPGTVCYATQHPDALVGCDMAALAGRC